MRCFTALCLATALVSTRPVLAGTWTTFRSNGTIVSSGATDPNSTFNIPVPGEVVRVEIAAPSENIGQIRFTSVPSGGGGTLALNILSGVNWNGLTYAGADVRIVTLSPNGLSGSITGAVAVNAVPSNFIIGGIQAALTISQPPDTNGSQMAIGFIGSGGSVTFTGSGFAGNQAANFRINGDCNGPIVCINGRIGRVEVLGNLRADIRAPTSTIQRIVVTGEIRKISDPGTFNPPAADRVRIETTGQIDRISADAIYANINTVMNGGNATIPDFATTAASSDSDRGDFVGSLTCGNLPVVSPPVSSAIRIKGRLTGSLNFTSNIFGQVLINSGNLAANSWTGSAVVGGMTLSPIPLYDLNSVVLGGGAIGQAPFALYANDCSPPDRATPGVVGKPQFQAGTQNVRLRFYGPVRAANLATAISIQRCTDPDSWEDASQFFATPQIVSVGGSPREIRLTDNPSNDIPVGTYRVINVSLLCDQVTGDVAVPAFDYRFGVSVDNYCPAKEFNCDGHVDADDLGDYINAYFAVPAPAGPGLFAVPCPGASSPYDATGYLADTNGDCLLDPDDLGDYINIYFAPTCP